MHRSRALRLMALLLVALVGLVSSAQAVTTITVKVEMKYFANGGTFSDGTKWKTQTKTGTGVQETGVSNHLTTTIQSYVPTRTGFNHVGWMVCYPGPSSDDVIMGATGSWHAGDTFDWYVEGSYQLKYAVAAWQEKTYAITYYSQGTAYTTGVKHHFNDAKIEAYPERTGYDLQGWDTSSNASTVKYKNGDLYSTNSALKLYAVWKIQTYAINYDANGGTGAPKAQTKTYGKNATVSTTKPTRSGYTFMGWAESPDSDTVDFASGAKLPDRPLNLYAVWSPNLSGNAAAVDGVQASEGRQSIVERLHIYAPNKISSFDIIVSYPAALQYEGLESNLLPNGIVARETSSGNTRRLELSGIFPDGLTAQRAQCLAKLQLRVESDNAHPFGDYVIRVENGSFFMDANGQRVPLDSLGQMSFTYLPYIARGISIGTGEEITQRTKLNVIFSPSYTTDKRLQWELIEGAAATLSNDGVLTPVKNGSVKVRVSTLDGSDLTAEKTFNITGQKAPVTAILVGNGSLSPAFSPNVFTYTVNVPNVMQDCGLTFDFKDGDLVGDVGYCFSGVQRRFDLTGASTVVTLTRSKKEYDDAVYQFTFVKKDVSTAYSNRLVLPSGLTAVEAEAFTGVDAEYVAIPKTCKSIGANAFANCAGLMCAVIPASVKDIDATAFKNCGQELLIVAPANSAGADYAATHGILYAAGG